MCIVDIKKTVDSSIWVEKYKPESLDDLLCDPVMKAKMKEFAEKRDIPCLLFEGSAGNGKTTCAKFLAKAVTEEDEDILFINASNETGIETVRNRIIPFCTQISMTDTYKVVILDEMEMSSESFQTALRSVIEQFYETTRFIFTCNYINRVIGPLQSRMQKYKFGNIDTLDVFKRCVGILNSEGVSFDKQNVAKIIKTLGTDMRDILNTMQSLVNEKEKVLKPFSSLDEKKEQLYRLITAKKLSEFRKFIGEHGLNSSEVVKFLFDKTFENKKGLWQESIGEISEAAYRLKVGTDGEIVIANLALQLMRLLK